MLIDVVHGLQTLRYLIITASFQLLLAYAAADTVQMVARLAMASRTQSAAC